MRCIQRLFVCFVCAVWIHTPASAQEWIWTSEHAVDGEVCRFRKDFKVPEGALKVTFSATADNLFTAYLDGKVIVRGSDWSQLYSVELVDSARPGDHRIEVECVNESGPAAFAGLITIQADDDIRIPSDPSWLVVGSDQELPSVSLGLTSQQGGIWRDPFYVPQATSPDAIEVPEGFEIELVYSSAPGEGSWSAMCIDGKGRAIISPQYGPLIRVTIPKDERTDPRVERLHATLGKAHGLVVADTDLYVNVADARNGMGGLWRMRDNNGDDIFEEVVRLAEYEGGSEHGPHGLTIGPEGALWMIHGNMTSHPDSLSASSAHRNWGEDAVLPRTWDPRGHAVNLMSPGGFLLKTDRDGSAFELVAGGMRNPYDIAFNAQGDLFTYDADMEWDIGAPWYRTPRLLHLVSGGEYGWRSGSAKWPIDSPDARPAVLELDAGSPTGVASGHTSSFPEPWRSRMYLADWAFGRVLAVDLIPDGASYSAEVHPFILGRPFNVSDLAFSPDGDLYLIIGGRGSQSGLYRVRWVGAKGSDAPLKPNDIASRDRMARLRLEASHRSTEAISLTELREGLAHRDSAVRYAARIGLERRILGGDSEWVIPALAETLPEDGGWELSLATVRAGDTPLVTEAVSAIIDQYEIDDSHSGQMYLARILGILLARHAPLEPGIEAVVLEQVEGMYPTENFSVDRQLVEILVALDSESVALSTMPRIETAATQEEAIHFLHALRLQEVGWDADTSRRAVNALIRAQRYSGGASLTGFIDATTSGLLAQLKPEFQREFERSIAAKHDAPSQRSIRPFVKNWTVEDIEPHLSRTYAYRNFEKGRQLFEDTQCVHCHQFGEVGSGYGPNLSEVGARFSPRDLLITMIDPERDLSDQYAGLEVTLKNGEVVLGMPVRSDGDILILASDPRSDRAQLEIPLQRILSQREKSVMPAGLLNSCTMDEVLDLLAYLSTGGNPDDPAFRSPP